jgi:hypothetical protein
MSASASVLNACATLQVELEENWKNCHTIRETTPFLEFLYSAENREPVREIISSGGGKIRTVEVRYDQRIGESAVNSNQSVTACSASTKRADYVKTYQMDINKNLQVEEKWDIQDLAKICRDNGVFMASRIQALIDALIRKLATVCATEAVALVGDWASDVTVDGQGELNVQTLRTGSTDQLYPYTMEEIDLALVKSGYCAPVAIFSGSTLYQYARRVVAGCCSDSGVDLGQLYSTYGKAVMWDRRIKEAYGSEHKALVAQLGALQLLTFNMFAGEGNAIEGGDYRRMVIQDPLTGIPIDFTMKDDCGTISLILTVTTKVIALPDDMFANGDVYDGVTYTGTIEVVNS